MSGAVHDRASSFILPHVAASNRFDHYFTSAVRHRGLEYAEEGCVTLLDPGPGEIAARVAGTREYLVEADWVHETLTISCDCPYAIEEGEFCKHIYAVLLEAEPKRLIPHTVTKLRLCAPPDDDWEDDDDEAGLIERERALFVTGPLRIGRPHTVHDRRDDWRTLFNIVGRQSSSASHHQKPIPHQVAYGIEARRVVPTHVAILGRFPTRSGRLGNWKPFRADESMLGRLDPFDRETILLLNRVHWGTDYDALVLLGRDVAPYWLERLSRAGKLLQRLYGRYHPLDWNDEPWEFRPVVEHDRERKLFRIRGEIVRGERLLPLEAIDFPAGSLLSVDGTLSRVRPGTSLDWLHALLTRGPVEIPFAQRDRLRAALIEAPPLGVELPEELALEELAIDPVPVLAVDDAGEGRTVEVELHFRYGPRITIESKDPSRWWNTPEGLIRRDSRREEDFAVRLRDLAEQTWSEWRVQRSRLHDVLATLIHEGWEVVLGDRPVRAADSFDVELGSSGIDWFDLHATARFGDEIVALPEILEAMEKKKPISLKDGSMALLPESFALSFGELASFGRREKGSIRFGRNQALVLAELLDTRKRDPDLQESDRFDHSFVLLQRKIRETVPAPARESEAFRGELRPYQRDGLGWFDFLRDVHLGGCLADDMGLGKTVQVLAMLQRRKGEADRPALVVAPRSLLFNWRAEAERFAPELRLVEHHGTGRGRSESAFDGCDVVLTTYGTLRRDAALLRSIEFDTVILDEAQAIKNASSQVSKVSRSLRARHRLALSGTPIENHLGELWSLFDFLNPGMLGSSRVFSRTFTAKSAPPERRQMLARALRPMILRRTKEQVAPELPERTEQTLYCELDRKQRAQYDELRDHYRALVLGRVEKSGMAKAKFQILEALLRLRQAACHPGLIDGDAAWESAKLDLLFEELAEVIDAGHRALVFSQFTTLLGFVRERLDQQSTGYCYLDGSTRDREQVVSRFQSDDGPPLFLISLKAGGLGLNLTRADYVFLLDPWWNPAVEAQAVDRAHRIGRVNPVVAYRIIARDTVEEKILQLQETKRALAESIITEDNSLLRRLDIDDLRILLS
jgi:SNF2 family DNA or RNA helicase